MFTGFDPLICYHQFFSHSGVPKVVVIALEAMDASLSGDLHDSREPPPEWNPHQLPRRYFFS